MKMGMGGMSFCSGGGVGEPYINPDIPAVANIVRAWSLRRNVPEYLLGNSIRADRPSAPVGNPGLLGAFNTAGVIDFPAGADAKVYELYDQKGEAGAALVVASGNLANAPLVYSSGKILKGLYFDGADYLLMGEDDAALETAFGTNTYTMAAWVKCGQTGTDLRVICGRVSNATGWNRLAFADGKVRAYVRSSISYLTSANSFNDDAWHLLVVIRDGVQGTANGSRLYVDGILEAQDEVRSASPATARFSVGANSAGTSTITGSVNDVIVWDVGLDQPAVTALYNAQKAYYGL